VFTNCGANDSDIMRSETKCAITIRERGSSAIMSKVGDESKRSSSRRSLALKFEVERVQIFSALFSST